LARAIGGNVARTPGLHPYSFHTHFINTTSASVSADLSGIQKGFQS